MKLAIVRKRFARTGGAERFIIDIMRTLGEGGVEAWLVSERFDEPGDLASRWIRVEETRGSRLQRYRGFQDGVQQAVRGKGFTLIQSHERILAADIFRAGDGVHAAWIDRLKRNRPWWRRPFTGRDAFHRHVMETERRMARETGMVFVANSNMVARELVDWLGVPPDRLKVIENGVDLSRFRPPTPEEHDLARAGFGLSGEETVVAFVGSGFERKGAFELLEALALPQSRGVRAIFAGADRDQRRFARRVKTLGLAGRATMTGPIADVVPVLHAADIFVLPTLYDPMPNAALEALACGLPVVTTADAGIAEAIQNAGAGAVSSRDPDALADAVARLAGSLEPARQAALSLRPGLDLDRITRQWLDFYGDLT